MRTNFRNFGSTAALPNRIGRPRSITPAMLDALREHLLKNPELYQDEMALFLWEKFKVHVNTSSILRVLNSVSWSKKKIRRVSKARNADLRDLYVHNTSNFLSFQMSSSMNLAAIKGMDLDEQDGLPLVCDSSSSYPVFA
jgi:hypothetical protein